MRIVYLYRLGYRRRSFDTCRAMARESVIYERVRIYLGSRAAPLHRLWLQLVRLRAVRCFHIAIRES